MEIEVELTWIDDENIKVWAQSKGVKEWMEGEAYSITGKTGSDRWKHLKKHVLKDYPRTGNYTLGAWGYKHLFLTGSRQYNLSFLRATELDKGIEVTLVPGFKRKYLIRAQHYMQWALEHFIHNNVRPKKRLVLEKEVKRCESLI